ncbi:MAG: DUF84 family protein [Candidatus Heimdallarchaeota archaeon]|nr:DUF84 family protein [Candidatus Heimdallarchaeota archaeon]
MKIIVCSKNPVKISAAEEAFKSHFKNVEVKTIDLSQKLGVMKQPMSSDETLNSAVKRIEVAQNLEKADYYVSMEGGMEEDHFGSFLTWYVCIANRKREKSIAGGGRMPLPRAIYKELKENKEIELGEIMDRITNEENVKQKGGSTAIFTGNRVMRKEVFKRALFMALIPFTSSMYMKLDKGIF